MRYALTLATAVILISGCAGTKPSIPIEQTIPITAGNTSVTIIAPQYQYLPGQAFYAIADYEYFLDCIEETCKIGRMHMMQYITVSPAAGKHTLFVKLAPDGIMGTIAIIGTDALSIPFESMPDKRVFISHAFEASLRSLLVPIAAPSATVTVIDYKIGHDKIQEVLDATSIFGTKLNGYGERGITYQR